MDNEESRGSRNNLNTNDNIAEDDDENEETFVGLFMDFMANNSGNGLPAVARSSDSIIRRLCWIVLCLAGTGYLLRRY